jgi:hypothetical protein
MKIVTVDPSIAPWDAELTLQRIAPGVDATLTARELHEDERCAFLAQHAMMLNSGCAVFAQQLREAAAAGEDTDELAAEATRAWDERNRVTRLWQARLVVLACRKAGIAAPADVREMGGDLQ